MLRSICMMGSLHASHSVLICSNSVQELTRGVRNQIAGLIRYISIMPCLCSKCVCKNDWHSHCKDQHVLADSCGPYSEIASNPASCMCSEIAGGQDLTPMSLGLSHSLSRYKLKFSPDKVSPDAAPGCLLWCTDLSSLFTPCIRTRRFMLCLCSCLLLRRLTR